MINQVNQNNQNTPSVEQSPAAKQKMSLMWPVLITFLFSAVVFGFGGYYLGTMNSQPQLIETQNEEPQQVGLQTSPSPVVTGNDLVTPSTETEWQTYMNPSALYEVSYPSGWRIQKFDLGEGYGPVEIQEDILWAVNFYSKDDYTLEDVSAEFGKQFSDRKQTREAIMVNNLSATKFITTTPSIPDWYLVNVVFEKGASYIVLSNGAITNENLQQMKGVASDTTFERFYESFHFVN